MINRFIDIKGNAIEVKPPHILWRDEANELGFLVNAELIEEVNIGEGDDGASAIQIFINDPNAGERLEYYFEFEHPGFAQTLATQMLLTREQVKNAPPEASQAAM